MVYYNIYLELSVLANFKMKRKIPSQAGLFIEPNPISWSKF